MVIGSFANGLNKMSDDKRERLRLATASEKLDAAAAKEESLLRKLVTLLDKEGIVKFKKIQIIACNTFTFTFLSCHIGNHTRIQPSIVRFQFQTSSHKELHLLHFYPPNKRHTKLKPSSSSNSLFNISMLCPLTTSFSSYYSVSKTRSFDIPSLTLYSVLIIIILSDYYTNNMGIALQLILPLILPQSTITKFHHHIYHIYAHLQCVKVRPFHCY